MEKSNQKEKPIKIVLTGGHAATVGIAVIEELQKRFKDQKVEISWVGSKKAVEGSNATTIEYKIYTDLGVKIYPIDAGKLQTKFTKYTIPSLIKIPLGFIQAFFVLIKLWPKVVLSLGGYASFPVVFWAWVFRIPIILHEQTVVAGRASMAASFFATKIALARIESQKFFPKEKSVVTGNPIMSSILSVPLSTVHDSPFTILVMGGSRGSEFINEEIIKIVPELIKKYNVIHITGERDFEKYKNYASKNYEVIAFVDPREMYKYYEKANLILSRSGATTVSEILATKRPVILIPLPRTFMDEQVKNAQYALKFGIAKVMAETEVNPESLRIAIENMIVHKIASKESPDLGAAEKLVDLLIKYV
ncbi:MAG TPA: UDP-N-acetylglucosamine--N-acetylmuramyl-(pentapeptide) pyrophosphoryl-undecaprenol N-acetylglucosamine transferase [Alphaproteobacteria bacterium]|jgi:UDP-N-acetylglucosamine--N-acetylmuramyl-(pentapeptide) pyrophosphoryl-undecaprenol N-acetylglucosamine transferase|nr:UDP-N-acetylglucosamine--N-acetylmuramyl-(pentapeptide) pyrophosphoryl-undecaprenol N-acetylglucosamine transferase [Alphaproteobacteria bacterium]